MDAVSKIVFNMILRSAVLQADSKRMRAADRPAPFGQRHPLAPRMLNVPTQQLQPGDAPAHKPTGGAGAGKPAAATQLAPRPAEAVSSVGSSLLKPPPQRQPDAATPAAAIAAQPAALPAAFTPRQVGHA